MGKDVVHLSLGEPGAKAPKAVLQAAIKKLNDGKIGYTESIGTLELRKKISLHYKRFYKLDIPFSNIAITTGASAAFVLCFLSILDIGDKVAVTSPCYPCYINILKSLGIDVVIVETDIKTNYQISSNIIENLNEDISAIIISTPANPTGATISKKDYNEIISCAQRKGIQIISDEIYHGITYDHEENYSALNLDDSVVVINSFSKYFAMTGWRLGWIIMPEEHIKIINKIAMNLYLSPSSLSQSAAIMAFNNYEELNMNVKQYEKNRNILIDGLNSSGINKFIIPKGAFYLYTDISDLKIDSRDFCYKMLNEAKVACVPGIDFDKKRGHRFVRFSFAGNEKEIIEGVKRINRWLS